MKRYPKTEKYDTSWIEKNWMGPNPLWLLEELCGHMDLRPGMRVLDLGCGKGITSVFLAKEYGVTVFANDLWISATDNLRRFEEADVADRVFPIHAEAHALPYAEGFFDAAIAVDSYHYFGASETYFVDVLSKLVMPGGQFGIVVPGLAREFDKGYPETLEALWFPELYTFPMYYVQYDRNLVGGVVLDAPPGLHFTPERDVEDAVPYELSQYSAQNNSTCAVGYITTPPPAGGTPPQEGNWVG